MFVVVRVCQRCQRQLIVVKLDCATEYYIMSWSKTVD